MKLIQIEEIVKVVTKILAATICTISVIGCSMVMLGCSNTPLEQLNVAKNSFGTNQTVEIKASSIIGQFIARTQDGAIYEVKCDVQGDSIVNSPNSKVLYKNCLFDPIYSVPPKPISPIKLEKE